VCCESVFECHGVVRVYLCVMGTHVGRGCTSQRYFRPRVLRRTAFVDVVCVTGMSAYESCSTVRMWRKGERENGVFSMMRTTRQTLKTQRTKFDVSNVVRFYVLLRVMCVNY
jgi:hypothetical protein